MRQKDRDLPLPGHIAIIMDGNGRWAKNRLLARSFGHRAGAQALDRLTRDMDRDGFKCLTVYAFSTENWNRSDQEVGALMELLRDYIKRYIKDAESANMRIGHIGDLTRLDNDLQADIAHLERITADKTGLNVNIAINYGARDEIRRAFIKMQQDMGLNGIETEHITEEYLSRFLDTAKVPDPDLIIRTGGEKRLSNFLLWQGAYSELYFTDKLWPDFSIDDLYQAVEIYSQRQRRFGR